MSNVLYGMEQRARIEEQAMKQCSVARSTRNAGDAESSTGPNRELPPGSLAEVSGLPGVSIADSAISKDHSGHISAEHTCITGQEELNVEVKLVGCSDKIWSFRFCPQDTMLAVKQALSSELKVPTDHLRLIWNGKQLNDDCSFEDYGILTGSRLFATLRMCGG